MLRISPRTIDRDIAELDRLEDAPAAGRVRRPGAGRKKIDSETPEEANLIERIEFPTAGALDEEDIIHTDLSPQDLSKRLAKMGTPVGKDSIDQWLDDAGSRRRQIRNDIPGGEHPDRDCQFERIAGLVSQYETAGGPWFSIDTKAKEHLGFCIARGKFAATVHSISPILEPSRRELGEHRFFNVNKTCQHLLPVCVVNARVGDGSFPVVEMLVLRRK